jgi:cytochrome d ubiquinol oxidase subunit I
MTFSGWVATLAGWYVTEIGRQPFLVSGVLRTAEAVTALPAGNVALSLTAYLAIYGFLLVAYVSTLFHLARKSADLERDLYDAGLVTEPMSQRRPNLAFAAGGG